MTITHAYASTCSTQSNIMESTAFYQNTKAGRGAPVAGERCSSSTFHLSVGSSSGQSGVGVGGGRFTEASIKTSVETENNKLAGNLWSYRTQIATELTGRGGCYQLIG